MLGFAESKKVLCNCKNLASWRVVISTELTCSARCFCFLLEQGERSNAAASWGSPEEPTVAPLGWGRGLPWLSGPSLPLPQGSCEGLGAQAAAVRGWIRMRWCPGLMVERWRRCCFCGRTAGWGWLGAGERRSPGTRDGSSVLAPSESCLLCTVRVQSVVSKSDMEYFFLVLRILIWEDRFDVFCSHWVFLTAAFTAFSSFSSNEK